MNKLITLATVGILAVLVGVQAQAVSASEWINNCMADAERPDVAKAFMLAGKPVPSHYDNRQYCIQQWNGFYPDKRIRDH